MKKKISGVQNPIFLPKNTKFFQKLTLFSETSVHQGGSAPLCPLWVRPCPLGRYKPAHSETVCMWEFDFRHLLCNNILAKFVE